MCRTFVRVWTIDVCFEMYPLFHLLFVVLLLEERKSNGTTPVTSFHESSCFLTGIVRIAYMTSPATMYILTSPKQGLTRRGLNSCHNQHSRYTSPFRWIGAFRLPGRCTLLFALEYPLLITPSLDSGIGPSGSIQREAGRNVKVLYVARASRLASW